MRWNRQNQLFLIGGGGGGGGVSTYFTVIPPGFQMLYFITESSL